MNHTFFDSVNSKCVSAKRNEWISVKDRLPEKDEYVLCFCNIGDGFQAIFHYGKERKFNGTAVTHWMPLPKPPEVTP